MKIYYIDVAFLINFCYDYLILISLKKLLFKKVNNGKCALGALIGALFSCVIEILNTTQILKFIVSIFVSFLMIYVSSDKLFKASFIKEIFTFYTISMLYGGFIFAFKEFLSAFGSKFSEIFNFENALFLIFSSFFVFLVTERAGKFFILKKTSRNACVTIKNKDIEKTLNLLVDSGNLLCDPYSGLPVIIIKQNIFFDIFKISHDIFLLSDSHSEKHIHLKPRLIPITTPAGTTSILGVIPDSINIGNTTTKVEAIVASDKMGSNFNDTDGILPSVLTQ